MKGHRNKKPTHAQEMIPLIVFSIKANSVIMLELKIKIMDKKNYDYYFFLIYYYFFSYTVCFSKVIPFTEDNRDGNRQQAMRERGESVFAVG